MITAVGRLKHGDHKASWAFIASWPVNGPAEFKPEDIALLNTACEEYAVVKIWQGEQSYQWWPTDVLADRLGVAI